jgi:rhodanese-related sulfurtransferase
MLGYGPAMHKLVAALLAGAALAGCSTAKPPGASRDGVGDRAPAKLPEVTVDELVQLLARQACQAVDANGDATRRRMGVLPGAVLLTSADSIDELPADKARGLVFYCANAGCGSSHHAAALARTAGYTNVQVLRDGIAGWVKAGQPTAPI